MLLKLSASNFICLAVLISSVWAQTVSQESLVVTNTKTGQVQVIDPADLKVRETHSVGHLEGAVIGNNQRLYYFDVNDVLGMLDLQTGQRLVFTKLESRLRRSHTARPSQLVLSPDNTSLVLSHHDSTGNVAEVGTFSLSVVDVETGATIYRIPPEEEQLRTSDAAACMIPQMLFSPDGTRLYELCFWGGSYPLKPTPLLRVVDLTERAFAGTLNLPKSQVAVLSSDGRTIYILSEKADLLVVDTSTLKIIETHSLSELGGPASVRFGARMEIAPDNQRLYFTDRLGATALYATTAAVPGSVLRLDLKEPIEDLAITRGDRLYVLTNRNLICLDTSDLREHSRVEMEAVSPRKCLLTVASVKPR
jgi:hypothetical protein